MALTLTDTASKTRPELWGQSRVRTKQVAFDSVYDLGGESLTPAMFGLTVIHQVLCEPKNGYTFEYDHTNQKLKVLPGVAELTEIVLKSAMTDGGGTSGFKDFAGTIPAGSLILGWRAVTSVGFTGDTSAVMIVGVSGDTDRFTADTATPSVFAAGIDGSNALAADAADGISAAVTPRVTVTSAADFTNVVGTGAAAVSVLYVPPTHAGADLSGLTGVRVTAIGY